MRKATTIIFAITLIIPYLLSVALADDQMIAQAVESVGEINAKDNNTGTAIAGMEADLILAVNVDMSAAEPGEEIESIRITLPGGFTAREGTVTSVRKGSPGEEEDVPGFVEVVDGNRITVVLPTLIQMNTIVTIEFTVDAPPTPVGDRTFIASLLNMLGNPIILNVTAGNADGRVNNDNLIIKTVAATKPDTPLNVIAEPDASGENDIRVSWAKSDDPGVSGYFIYRSDKGDEIVADVMGSDQTDYVDRNLNAGEEYSYTVRSYKTQKLKSDASKAASAVAPEDTNDPQPPTVQSEVTVTDKGIEIIWEASLSQDVTGYVVYRGASLDSREILAELTSSAVSYLDENPPESGSYLYAVAAVDDVGKESTPSPTQFRRVLSGLKPEPNPFTPLSADARYNQITFSATMLEGGEGAFAVKVFDLEGDLVFEKEPESSKEITITWDGRDMNGEYVDSGIYVYQATMGSENQIGTIIVAK